MMIRIWSESIRNYKYLIGVWALLIYFLAFRLDSVPPLWLDEGWIMTVARNLVELGHYGRLLNGVPYPETIINIGVPVIAPIAFSFFLFGVGILQARITIVLFTLAALFVFYKLVERLYNSKISLASLLVILILPFDFSLNPLFIGRQALGELPALFYLVSGYLFFLLSQRKSWAICIAVIFWVLAILSKFQILPFLCFGLIAPAIVMLIKRNYKQAMLFGLGLAGTILLVRILGNWTPVFNSNLSKQSLAGLIRAIVLVPDLVSRSNLFRFNLPFIAPIVLGMSYATIKLRHDEWNTTKQDHAVGVKLSILSLISAWFLWFFMISIGWSRHLTIPIFLGSMFVALAIHDLTRGFESLSHLRQGRIKIIGGNLSVFIPPVLILALIIAWILIDFLVIDRHLMSSSKSIVDVANFINSSSDANALVEATDFEVFVFINRKYHFPQDEIQMVLLEQISLEKSTENIYHPLEANPDYVIVGPFGRKLEIYKEIEASDQFALIKSFKYYDVYAKDK